MSIPCDLQNTSTGCRMLGALKGAADGQLDLVMLRNTIKVYTVNVSLEATSVNASKTLRGETTQSSRYNFPLTLKMRLR